MLRRMSPSVLYRGVESEPENLGLSMPRLTLRSLRESP